MLLPGILAGAAAVAGGRWWLFSKGQPPRSGQAKVAGLEGEVELLRDTEGIPHIFAKSEADAAFGLGFAHAQDRLFQLELNRRVGAGRLSEFAGPAALEADRFLRRLGLYRTAVREAATLDPIERALGEAYARGVNAAVAQLGGRRPLELRLLRLPFAPWTVADSLSYGLVMSLNLSTNFEAELLRMKLVEALGPERAARFALGYPRGMPIAVPPGTAAPDSAGALARAFAEVKPFLPFGAQGASNNWVVSGARTESGKPLLANDPHLSLQLPNIWYEAHLVAPGLDVYGVTLPGTPGVVLGHNRKVAWGMTNSGADVQDLYVERFEPGSRRYLCEDGWREAEVVRETIRVKGRPDVIEEVVITRHGPVLAGEAAGGEGPSLALRWAAYEPGNHILRAVREANRASSAEELKQALRHWHTPSQNFVFADAEGNIGYLMAGLVPVRAKGSGLTPVPGWTGEYEWTGYVPFEELPQLSNPERGFIVTANNAIVGPEFPHFITWDWMSGSRAKRIEALLEEKPKLTAEDFRRIQMDVFCEPGLAFAARCRALGPVDALERHALRLLLEWDGQASAESGGAAVYETMLLALAERALLPSLGRPVFELLMGRTEIPLFAMSLVGGRYTVVLVRAVTENDPALLPDAPAAGSPEARWDALLALALKDATARCRKRLGGEPATWRWGSLHRLTLKHPLGRGPLLGAIFNGPTIELGGDTDTPLQTAYVPHAPFNADGWAPSWRQIVDLADVRRSQSIHVTGQSGHPRSRHYLDFLPRWHQGQLHPQWLDREEIEQHLEGRWSLLPAPSGRGSG